MRTNLSAAVVGLLIVIVAGCSATVAPSSSPAAPASAAAGTVVVSGIAQAGPVCPVERPGDPACDPRPVEGARITVLADTGGEVGRATTAVDGSFEVDLAPGEYDLVAQPVPGIPGTAPTVHIHVAAGGGVTPDPIELEYDTGIR